MNSSMSRRRFLSVCAMAGVYAALPWADAIAHVPLHHWRGILLGAQVNLSVAHSSRAQAERIFGVCVGEVKRLEQIFTLYDSHSELSRLNANGVLRDPSPEFIDILQQSLEYRKLTGGAFDVRIKAIEDGIVSVFPEGQDMIVDRDMIAFKDKDMSITLNGIAQGYITDQMTDLLRNEGLSNVLVELGETRAIGGHPAGRDWQIGLMDHRDIALLNNMALASSSAMNGDTGKPHIYDARDGRLVQSPRLVSVIAQSAAMADALSTAFISMSNEEIADLKSRELRIKRVYL